VICYLKLVTSQITTTSRIILAFQVESVIFSVTLLFRSTCWKS